MGKVVVITGASSGIGAALAQRLGNDGYKIVLAARNADTLHKVAAPLGKNAITVVTDVTRREDHGKLRAAALAAFGTIDVWINNAGQGIARHVLEVTDDDFDHMMLVNTKSALYGMQTIVPYFQETGHGHLINVSSFLARVPIAPIRSAYSAAKAALNSLTTNLRMDLLETYPGIHVSIVMPGVVNTQFGQNSLGSGKLPPPPPPPSGGPMASQNTGAVVDIMVQLLLKPQPEVYTNPASPDLAQQFWTKLGAFNSELLHG